MLTVLWGSFVLACIEKGISLDELPISEYKAISPVFEEDILRCHQYADLCGKENDTWRTGTGSDGKRDSGA